MCVGGHILKPTTNLLVIEVSYSLNYVIEKGQNDPWKWSIRRTAVYHKFVFDTASSTWIVVYPSQRAQQRLQERLQASQTSHDEFPVVGSSLNMLELHMVLVNNATENWRSYSNCLEMFLEKKVESIQPNFFGEIACS